MCIVLAVRPWTGPCVPASVRGIKAVDLHQTVLQGVRVSYLRPWARLLVSMIPAYRQEVRSLVLTAGAKRRTIHHAEELVGLPHI